MLLALDWLVVESTDETLVSLLGLDGLLALDCDVVEFTDEALDAEDEELEL